MAFTRYQQCECSWTDSIFWGTWFIIHNKNQPSSGGKESTCNAGDPGLIPRFGKIRWRRDRSPLQYSGSSLMAQLVKKLPAMWETLVRSLGWEDPLEKGTATHSRILAWRISWSVYGVAKSWTRLGDFHFH